MPQKTMIVRLTHKRRITGGMHEVVWGDRYDWKKGTLSVSSHRDWAIAKAKYEALKDKFRVQGFAVKASIRK